MEIVTLFVAAFLQFASLSLDELRQTVHAIATAVTEQYVDIAAKEKGPAR